MLMKGALGDKVTLCDAVGDISGITLFNGQVLCAIYIRPEKTASGIYLSDQTRKEDEFQGKVGLILKKGPSAFVDSRGEYFTQGGCDELDWVLFRASDGWPLKVNGVLCRLLDDVHIRATLDRPDRVW
jgi:co-chaperonin GroES (HSP10)